MFNLSGSEIVFLLLIALIVLGPEKLPEAVRKFGKVYAEAKKMSTGFQSELKSALDEPMREMRETAEAFKNAANLNFDIDADETPQTPAEPEAPAQVAAGNEPPSAATDVPHAAVGTDADNAAMAAHIEDQLDAIDDTIASHPDTDETATE